MSLQVALHDWCECNQKLSLQDLQLSEWSRQAETSLKNGYQIPRPRGEAKMFQIQPGCTGAYNMSIQLQFNNRWLPVAKLTS